MPLFINEDNLHLFAYTNLSICKKPYRGITVEFMGLGAQNMFSDDIPRGKHLAENGILFIIPYLNPWNWMNTDAARQTDALIEVLMQITHAENLPILSTGGSMGGLNAIVYCSKSRLPIAGCVANCPVCDLVYHYSERPDLPRTLYNAYFSPDISSEAALLAKLEESSPIHLARQGCLPDIPYIIFHCEKDMAVNIDRHTHAFLSCLPFRNVHFISVPDKGHCDLPEDMVKRYEDYLLLLSSNPKVDVSDCFV